MRLPKQVKKNDFQMDAPFSKQEKITSCPLMKSKYVSVVSNDTSSFITSVDQSVEMRFPYIPVAVLQPVQDTACIYDNNWWIGNMCEISIEEQDALINFMFPHGTAQLFHWRTRHDKCWIPEKIIAIIPAPTATFRMAI